MLTGRIFLTGGAGFLGRGIMREARARGWDCEFIVYSRDEQKHFYAKQKYPNARYIPGDINDPTRMHLLMSACDLVIHTAAIKYIPECEASPSEALRVNVDGSRLVMQCASEAGVKRVCLISTDKAADPVNTYGMTKAMVERLVFQTADIPSPSGTEYVACRYGNVIASTGSLWPMFRHQFAQQGKLRLTEPTMTRFYISIQEAVSLIESAFAAPPGTVVIPQPEAISLADLADHVTKLWNAEPYEVVGPRPGEKLHENMLGTNEASRLSAYGRRYILEGPTKQAIHPAGATGMRSDLAAPLSPEDFVSAALDGESV